MIAKKIQEKAKIAEQLAIINIREADSASILGTDKSGLVVLLWQVHSAGGIPKQCANDISKVWAYAQEKEQSHPEALQEFRTRVEKRVKATSDGRTLDEWLELAVGLSRGCKDRAPSSIRTGHARR